MNPTRRKWARRAIRAGWLIAPIFAAPKAIWNFLFSTLERTIYTLLFIGIISGIGSCTMEEYDLQKIATAEEITAALKEDWCMTDLMPRRQAETQLPLTNRDLVIGKRDCAEAQKKHKAIEQQRAAMKAAK